MTIGVYAGTFDPLTNGHIDIIKRSFSFCDKLIIGIGVNPAKKTLFTEKEREKQVATALFDLYKKDDFFKIGNVKVETFDGLLVNFAKKEGAKILIRGIRSVSDFEYELTLASANKILAPGVETVFLPTSPELAVVSSSLVKEVAKYQGDISSFVPLNIEKALQSIFVKD
jgi:pantetheine-phosphate adenylyltransferase